MSKAPPNKFNDWHLPSTYSLEKILGRGSYGEVASAIHNPSGKKVAVKVMRDVFDVPTDVKRAYREMHILRYYGLRCHYFSHCS